MGNRQDNFLLISGKCKDLELLTNQTALARTLNNLPSLIGMRALREPIISEAPNNPGLEGYVPIDTSNITISTYTQEQKVVACIHSCREFEWEIALNYLKKEYSLTDPRFLFFDESHLRGENGK